jgi:hypothetical protein
LRTRSTGGKPSAAEQSATAGNQRSLDEIATIHLDGPPVATKVTSLISCSQTINYGNHALRRLEKYTAFCVTQR